MNPLEALEMSPGASFGEARAVPLRRAEVFGMPGEAAMADRDRMVPLRSSAGRGRDRFDALMGRLFKRG